MRKFKIKIDSCAIADTQEITEWYNRKQANLGNRFENTATSHINKLTKTPHKYAIRYKEIRCMLVKKFPYLVHFYINEETNTVEVLAIISTFRNPKIWEDRTKDVNRSNNMKSLTELGNESKI